MQLLLWRPEPPLKKESLMRLAQIALVILTITAAVYANSSEPSLPPFTSSDQGHLFTLQGSNTVGARLAPELARDYLQAKGLINLSIENLEVENEYRVLGHHPDSGRVLSIELAAHGSGTAFSGLASGKADIGMSSRAIKDAEVEALRHYGDMRSFEAEKVVAIDGLAVIVHPRNPIGQLTLEQIARIFSGEISDWKDVGGNAGPINLYARDHKSGTWDTFKSLVLRKEHQLNPAARRFESNDEISRLVQKDVAAIGFVGLASVGNAKPLAVSDSNTRALLPTPLTVATEDYLLARRLFMYVSPHNSSPLVKEYLAFAQSRAGQERVAEVGYVAQNPIRLPPGEFQDPQSEYAQLVGGAERLSINIRFKRGSAVLDNKARQDILRLSEYMKQPEQQGAQLLLIGFGDAKQTPQRARILSQLRALTVRAALRDYGLHTLPVEGMGDRLPVADHDSENRTKNQRVEIWII